MSQVSTYNPCGAGMLMFVDFLNSHPGGANVVLHCAGKDATDVFDSVHSPELLSETLPGSTLKGYIDAAEFDTSEETQNSTDNVQSDPDPGRSPPLQSLINLHDFERVAQSVPPKTWAYYSSGADDEISKRNNERLLM